MNRKYIYLLAALSFCFLLCADQREIVVAAWNVENLFDPADNPETEGDDAYTPGGWAQWTENKYRTKLKHLSEVIADIKPDILCLSEVENRKVLVDLTEMLATNFNYAMGAIIHRESEDFRGIDVAMIAQYTPVRTNWFNAVEGQRDVLACRFLINGGELTVIGNHWKSKLGKPEESDAIRTRQAASVRSFIYRELANNPAAAIVVAGDFNCDITEGFLTESAGFITDRAKLRDPSAKDKLYNLAAELGEQQRKTYYYVRGERWNSFDSISVTRGMLGVEPLSPWQVKPGSYSVYKPDKVTFKGLGSPLPYRRVRSKQYGDRFVAGYSDHFAVYVVLTASEGH